MATGPNTRVSPVAPISLSTTDHTQSPPPRPESPRTAFKSTFALAAIAEGVPADKAKRAATHVMDQYSRDATQWEVFANRVLETGPKAVALVPPKIPSSENAQEAARRKLYNDVTVVFRTADGTSEKRIEAPQGVLNWTVPALAAGPLVQRTPTPDLKKEVALTVDNPQAAVDALQFLVGESPTLPVTVDNGFHMFALATSLQTPVLAEQCKRALPALMRDPHWLTLFKPCNPTAPAQVRDAWYHALADALYEHAPEHFSTLDCAQCDARAMAALYGHGGMPLTEKQAFDALMAWATPLCTAAQSPAEYLRSTNLLQVVRFEHMPDADLAAITQHLTHQELQDITSARILRMNKDYSHPTALMGRSLLPERIGTLRAPQPAASLVTITPHQRMPTIEVTASCNLSDVIAPDFDPARTRFTFAGATWEFQCNSDGYACLAFVALDLEGKMPRQIHVETTQIQVGTTKSKPFDCSVLAGTKTINPHPPYLWSKTGCSQITHFPCTHVPMYQLMRASTDPRVAATITMIY